VRSFVVIGQRATASPGFLLDDLPGTSGRIDLLLRCVRSALLVSHGVRRDTRVYLVLLGGPDAPKSIRVDGSIAEFLRPDERSMATRVQKALSAELAEGWTALRHGWAVARGGVEVVLADLGGARRFVLDEGGRDVRSISVPAEVAFFVGDHTGIADLTVGADAVSIGPRSVHADDAIAIVHNELDRRAT
jgi:tRNA (pseudouridine54-N1)-methyltransferase